MKPENFLASSLRKKANLYMKDKNIPRLRFPGFTEPWEHRKLEDLVSQIFREVPKPDHPYERISVRSHAKGTFHQQVEDPDKVAMDKLFLVKENDLIVNITFAWEHAIAVATKEDDGLYVSHRFPTYRADGKSDIEFIHYLVSQESFRKKLELISPGGAGRNRVMNQKAFLGLPVIVPSNIEEQHQIGMFFTTIDHTITLHQRKLDNLQKLKKGLLQKMFPKEGSSFPELRFPEFTDAWEQRQVAELTTELSEYATLASKLPLLTSSRMGLIYQNEYRGNLTTQNQNTLFSVVPLGAGTYRHMSDDNIFHLNLNTLEKGLVSREYPVFIASKNNDLNFIVQYLNSSPKFRTFCTEQKKGGTRTRLYYKTLCEFSMMIPQDAEQSKISRLLFDTDNLITLHQRKLDDLKKLKKGLLQAMFV